jgi:hypothetical protein
MLISFLPNGQNYKGPDLLNFGLWFSTGEMEGTILLPTWQSNRLSPILTEVGYGTGCLPSTNGQNREGFDLLRFAMRGQE